MDNRDLQEKLLETLNEINSSISFGETSIKDSEEQTELAQKLVDIYSNSDFRHSYASISSFLEGCMPDQRDALIKKLVAIHEYVIDTMPSTCDKECVIKSLTKLRDHVELESIRINRMKHISHIGEKIAKEKEGKYISNLKREFICEVITNTISSLYHSPLLFHLVNVTYLKNPPQKPVGDFL